MKVLAVTSNVTYVPDNQQQLFEELFAGAAPHLAGLVVLDVITTGLIKQIAGLYAAGCRNLAHCLAGNLLRLPLRRREALWTRRHLPVLRARSMNEPWVIRWVRDNEIDLIVNLRTRCIYGKEILGAPTLGCVNIHHGILPEYRGTFCDLYALSEGRPAGFSIHRMIAEVDAGDILFTQALSTGNEKDYLKYLATTGRAEGKALADILNFAARHGVLPEGYANSSANTVFTRTPNRREIKRLRARGLVL